MATATPVPTSARSNGASCTSSVRVRSAPASPGRAYRGGVAPGAVSRTGTSRGSDTTGTLTAPGRGPRTGRAGSAEPAPQVAPNPPGEGLRGPEVDPAAECRTDQQRRRRAHAAGDAAGQPAAEGAEPGGAEDGAQGLPLTALDGALLGPAGEVGGGPLGGGAGG